MKSAAGGAAVPGWVPAIPELETALKMLASDSVVISDQLLVEKYGEALFAATGFTKRAELINGRLAVRLCGCAVRWLVLPAHSPTPTQMIGFVAAVGATFKGDILTQLARAPMGVALTIFLIITATLVPDVDAEAGYIPGNVRQAVDKLMASTGLDAFFTETAETVNGRAAMMGMLVFLLTATLF